ncbi:MAG: hypothetical protein PQJ46_08075, partial [Spirochaetales bacterium]|nr:hypothetical protein [Spirochaetales bacterium]
MYKTISRERNFFILILSSVCVILPIADLVFFLTGDFSIKSIIFFILSLIPITAFWIILRLYKKADKENVRHHKVAERLYKTFNDGKDTELSDLEGFSDTLQTSLEQLKLNIAQLNLIDRDVHLIRLLKGPDQDLELILEKL